MGRVTYHTPVQFLVREAGAASRWERTTAGRVLFNSIIPDVMPFQNREMKKKALCGARVRGYRSSGLRAPWRSSTGLKEFGFRYATMGGVSIGVEDLEIPEEKETLLEEAETRVERFQRAYQTGNITNGERYNKVIDTWTHANNDIADAMVKAMSRVEGRAQSGVHDVRLRLTRQPRSDPSVGGDARSHGEAAEEAHRRHR